MFDGYSNRILSNWRFKKKQRIATNLYYILFMKIFLEALVLRIFYQIITRFDVVHQINMYVLLLLYNSQVLLNIRPNLSELL